jgi:threonine dehydratase
METLVTLAEIKEAQARIRGVARHTPLLELSGDRTTGTPHVYLKADNLQPIGAFKIRGAFNRLAALSAEEKAAGVIAYSSGNHAQGVAYAARQLGIKAVIVMPTNAPAVKINATRSFGAEVVLYDPATEKREEVAAKLMQGQNWTLVPPFNDPYVIAGQGTAGLEIFEDLPEIELVLIPVGGGGLLSGVATALKSLKPSVKIIGVEPELAADAYESFKSGSIVEYSAAKASRTIADGVRTSSVGKLTFAHIKAYVDDIITVSEAEIQEGVRRLLFEQHLLVEPAGVLPYAAYFHHRAELPAASHVVLMLSGGNIDPVILQNIIAEGL